MFKTIIFDLNHVIVSYKDSRIDHEYQDMLGVSRDKFWDIAKKYYPQHNIGKIGIDEYFSRVLSDLKLSPELLPMAKHLFKKEILPVAGMKDILIQLKGRYRLILLAGDGRDFLEAKLEKFKLKTYFDEIYATCYEGLQKNEPEIYKRVLKKEKLQPEDCIFVDDTDEYIKAAKKAGIKNIIHFRDSSQLQKDLKKFGIELK